MGQPGRFRVWVSIALAGLLVTPFLHSHAQVALADSSSTPPLVADDDGFVQPTSSTGGTGSTILLKNAVAGAGAVSSRYNRVGYARFTYDPDYVWTSASFEMVVSSNNGGSNPAGWNTSYTTFNIDVWGLTDASWNDSTLTFTAANDVNNLWGIDTAAGFPWNPNDTDDYLGAFAVPTRTNTAGETFSLSNQALVEFLNADSDGEVSLYFRRSDTDNQGNLAFWANENTSGHNGPRIVVPSGAYDYTISYDVNGGAGTLPSPGTYTSGSGGYTVESPSSVTPPAGKLFVGWNSRADGGGDNYSVGSTYSTASSVTLYAQYSSDTQEVSFNANGGSGSMSNQTVNSGVAAAINTNSFTRSGHSFSGWNTSADGSGTAYANGANITTSSPVTLYAQWAAVSTVSFNANGGSGSMSNQTVNSGVAAAINTNSFTRSGHSFSGWNTSADGSGTAYANGANITTSSAVTLYAQWAANSSSGGSSSQDSLAASETPAPVAPVPAPRRTPLPQTGPNTDPVTSPVERLGLVFDPDSASRATVGGAIANLSKIPLGPSALSLAAGAFEFGVRLNEGSGAEVQTDTPSDSPELFVPRGDAAEVSGEGSYPGSFVQVWLPGQGHDSRELARIPVRSDGTFASDLSFAAGAMELPVPIGRQVLQVVGYDEQGNQTVVDMTINIGQGVPAPEPNRQVGALPDLNAGESLATSGGIPESVSLTGVPETGSVVVEGNEWVISVNADRDNGVVEDADGDLRVQLKPSSVGTASGNGFLPGTLATVWLFSEPTLMTTVTIDENGEFSSEFLVDARLIAPGEHTLQVQGVGADGYIKAANLGVLVEQPLEVATESAAGLLWWVAGAFLLLLLVVVFVIVARRRRA